MYSSLFFGMLLVLCTVALGCWDDDHCRCHTSVNYCYDKQKRRHALEKCVSSSQCFCNHRMECLSIYIPPKDAGAIEEDLPVNEDITVFDHKASPLLTTLGWDMDRTL